MPIANRWLGLLCTLILLILVPFFLLEEPITHGLTQVLETELTKTLLAGLIACLLASDIVLPVPSSLVTTTAGAALGFGAGTVVCWIGMSLGCSIGYWLGSVAFTPAVQRFFGVQELEKARILGKRYGAIVLVVTRAVPVLAEASVITAGSIGVPWRTFIIVTSFSNLGVSAVYSGIGAFALEIHSYLLAFSGAILVPGLAILLIRLISRPGLTAGSTLTKRKGEEKTPSSKRAGAMVEQRFSVAYHYQVYFTYDIFNPSNLLFVRSLTQRRVPGRHSLTVFIDDGVTAAWPNLQRNIEGYAEAHQDHLHLVTSPISVPGGERSKNNPEVLQMIYRRLFDLGVDRHSFVVAIGGGAVLDLVGFAAATTHRGVHLVRLPTTVLGQNDAGVGVKTGMNLFDSKNFIGSFAPPYAVFNDSRFLETLSSRDRRAGIAEAVKVALIKDPYFFRWLEKNAQLLTEFDEEAMSHMICQCAELHMCHIAQNGDPFETGNVRPLDFGHWAAHKLESLTKHELRHGEAVAMGMAIDTRYAVQTGLLQRDIESRIFKLFEDLGFELWHPVMQTVSSEGNLLILDGLREFREHLGGALCVTLPVQIGESIEIQEMDHREIEQAIQWLKARYLET